MDMDTHSDSKEHRENRLFASWVDSSTSIVQAIIGILQIVVGGIAIIALTFYGNGLQEIANELSEAQNEIQQSQFELEKASYSPEFAIIEADVVNGVEQDGLRFAKISGKAENLRMKAWDHVELRIEKYPYERSDLEAYYEPAPAIALDVEGLYPQRGISSEGGYIVIAAAKTESITINGVVKRLNEELEPLGYRARTYSRCIMVDVTYNDISGDPKSQTFYVNAYNTKTILQEWEHEPSCCNPIKANISLKDFESGNSYPFDKLALRCIEAYKLVNESV